MRNKGNQKTIALSTQLNLDEKLGLAVTKFVAVQTFAANLGCDVAELYRVLGEAYETEGEPNSAV